MMWPWKEKKSLAIWGWWQGKNLGDNWIRQVWQEHFPEAHFIDTTVKEFKSFKYVICGGGGLFIRCVIPPWDREIKIPYGFAGMGAEFKHKDRTAAELATRARFFYVRDDHSLECMNLDPAHRSYDLTFVKPLPPLAKPPGGSCFFVWRDPNELLAYEDFNKYIGPPSERRQWLDHLKSHFEIVFADDFGTTRCDIQAMTESAGFIVSARYHGILAAIQRGVPCIAIDICPKIRAVMDECGLAKYCIQYKDVDILPELIEMARSEQEKILGLQEQYTQKATIVMNRHFKYIQKDVASVTETLETD